MTLPTSMRTAFRLTITGAVIAHATAERSPQASRRVAEVYGHMSPSSRWQPVRVAPGRRVGASIPELQICGTLYTGTSSAASTIYMHPADRSLCRIRSL